MSEELFDPSTGTFASPAGIHVKNAPKEDVVKGRVRGKLKTL